MKIATISIVGLALGTAFMAGASVATAKSGTYDVTYCSSGESQVIAHSDDHLALTFHSFGTVRSKSPGDMFDMLSSECIGVVGITGGEVFVTGYCEYVDPDGDRKFGTFTEAPGQAKGKWRALNGTGKYTGLVEEGTYDTTDFPAIRPSRSQHCGNAIGTWTLP